MSERDQQRPRSPLESERGITTVDGGVVSKIAGLAAGEVEGIHMGSSASRAAGGIFGSITGSRNPSRGISVQVGRVETAIDLTLEIEYGRNMLRLTEAVRDRLTERVESLTGLRVAELNVTINDVIFSDRQEGGEGHRDEPGYEDRPRARLTEEIGSRERGAPEDTEPIEVRARERARSEGEREVRAEDAPREEDPTTELRLGDDETGRGRRRDRRREG